MELQLSLSFLLCVLQSYSVFYLKLTVMPVRSDSNTVCVLFVHLHFAQVNKVLCMSFWKMINANLESLLCIAELTCTDNKNKLFKLVPVTQDVNHRTSQINCLKQDKCAAIDFWLNIFLGRSQVGIDINPISQLLYIHTGTYSMCTCIMFDQWNRLMSLVTWNALWDVLMLVLHS